MSSNTGRLYEFGPFSLDVSEHRLLRSREVVPLSPKVFETLLVLVEQGGHVVEKGELMRRLWPDSFVEESSLTQNISLIRKALGEGGGEQQFIETVPKRGYRFVAPVRVLEGGAAEEEEEVGKEATGGGRELPDSGGASTPRARASSPRRLLPKGKLMWAGVAAVALPALLAGVYLIRTAAGGQREWAAAGAGGQIRSLAVLPFKPLGEGSRDEFLGLGMADALIIRLGTSDQLRVMPTSSVIKYAGREYDAVSVGKALGVDAVLDGTVQQDRERVRVTVMLLSLRDGKALWSGTFDERFTDIFALQDAVSERLANVLQPRLAAGQRPPAHKRFTEDIEAYRHHMMGLYFWNKRSKDGLTRAIEYFRQATERDPNYALAYAYLADSYSLTVYYRYDLWPSVEAYRRAHAAATRALELDDTLAEAHAVMAMLKAGGFEVDYEGAERSYRRAVELNPNSAVVRLRYASFLLARLRLDEAIPHMRRAQELDPLSPTINTTLGAYYYFAAQYDEALRYSKLALEIEPTFGWARMNLAQSYERKGMHDEALAEYGKLSAQEEFQSYGRLGTASVYARTGREVEAKQLAAEVEGLVKSEKAPSDIFFQLALLRIVIGDKDAAFFWLERAVGARVVNRSDLRYARQLDALKDDPRFGQMLSRHEYTKSLAPELSRRSVVIESAGGR
jgi:DNA-binding winged helix-turn-helix (wHTH) protein/TolB-like protein/Flp pilus assembly protein TadD